MPKVYCLSDRAIQIDWPADHSASNPLGWPAGLALFRQVLTQRLNELSLPDFQCVQADSSLTLIFRQSVLVMHSLPSLVTRIQSLLDDLFLSADNTLVTPRHHVLDVTYGGVCGQDLQWIADQAGLSMQGVIDLHSQSSYTVNFLGFLPGFAYLNGLPAQLQFPRRSSPRAHVPAGSLAIGAHYCAVYPWESPGGWHLIGHVKQPLFNPERADGQQALLQPGDTVQFRQVDHA